MLVAAAWLGRWGWGVFFSVLWLAAIWQAKRCADEL